MSKTRRATFITVSLALLVSLARAEEEPAGKPPGAGGEEAEKGAQEAKGGEETAAEGEEEEAVPEKDPAFKKDTGKNDFIRAKILFDEAKYKEAAALFKKSKPEAREKEDKAIVDGWIQAADGAQVIDKLKVLVKQNRKALAFEQAEINLKKYAKTPAERQFKQFLNELESQILQVIQGFENMSSAYSEKYGKTYVTDRSQVFEGGQCLRWTNTEDRKVGRLKIEGVPQDWREYEAIEFHVNVKTPPAAPEAVIMSLPSSPAGAKAKKKADEDGLDFLLVPIKLPAQEGVWEKVRIPLKDFKASGRGSLEKVSHFQIQVGRGKVFELLIDKVALVRKDGGAEGTAKTDEGKRKSGGKR